MQEKFIQSKEYKETLDTKIRREKIRVGVNVFACMFEEGGEEEEFIPCSGMEFSWSIWYSGVFLLLLCFHL